MKQQVNDPWKEFQNQLRRLHIRTDTFQWIYKFVNLKQKWAVHSQCSQHVNMKTSEKTSTSRSMKHKQSSKELWNSTRWCRRKRKIWSRKVGRKATDGHLVHNPSWINLLKKMHYNPKVQGEIWDKRKCTLTITTAGTEMN